MANGKPISHWLKKNLAQGGKYSSNSSITNSPSYSTPGSRSTVIEGLLSIDTSSSSFDENDQPQSVIMVNPPTSYNNLSPNTVCIGQKYSSCPKSFNHVNLSTIKEDYRRPPWNVPNNGTFKKMRERQFGTRSSLKRLSRYKMRPSLFSAYPNPDYAKPTSTTTATDGKVSPTKNHGKHIRIGLFYTWSFGGQRQRKVVTLGENQLGENPKLDKLWEEAAKVLRRTDDDDDDLDVDDQDDKNLKDKHFSNRFYESPKELESEIIKQEMSRQWSEKGAKWNETKEQNKADVGAQPTFQERYPNGSSKSLYRNIYPYTTVRQSNNNIPADHRKNYAFASYQYNCRTLPVSKRKLFRADQMKSENGSVGIDCGKNVETIHKNFYDMMTGSCATNALNRADYHGYYSNPVVPMGPVLITSLSAAQTSPMNMPLYPASRIEGTTRGRRFRCSGRNCIFAWALGLTAALILALAIALFVQSKMHSH